MVLSTVVIISIVLFFPETLRTIAGDGSVILSGIHKPVYQIHTYDPDSERKELGFHAEKFTWNDILVPFKFLFEKDVFVTLLFGAVVYAIFSMVSASTTSSLKRIYGFNDVLVGLLFLPNGQSILMMYL